MPMEVSDTGEVIAIYSNSKRQTVAQVVLADFANMGGLAQQGNNLWQKHPSPVSRSWGRLAPAVSAILPVACLKAPTSTGRRDGQHDRLPAQLPVNSQTIKTQSEVLQTLVNLR